MRPIKHPFVKYGVGYGKHPFAIRPGVRSGVDPFAKLSRRLQFLFYRLGLRHEQAVRDAITRLELHPNRTIGYGAVLHRETLAWLGLKNPPISSRVVYAERCRCAVGLHLRGYNLLEIQLILRLRGPEDTRQHIARGSHLPNL